jgi:hypothetical protein
MMNPLVDLDLNGYSCIHLHRSLAKGGIFSIGGDQSKAKSGKTWLGFHGLASEGKIRDRTTDTCEALDQSGDK